MKDAAAKGVSVEKEKVTSHGWLAKSIFAYNNLYCEPGVAVCPPPEADDELDSSGDEEDGVALDLGKGRMVDGISLGNAAAGPNALEVSDSSIDFRTFNHISGVKHVDAVVNQPRYDYINPFVDEMSMMSSEAATSEAQMSRSRTLTEQETWDKVKTNLGLEELLDKEASIFEGVGVMQAKLNEYKDELATKCPGFPAVEEWADTTSDGEVGMQLRAVAIMMINGVTPKVFQLQQTRYDTHANQGPRLVALLSDLKTGVFTFMKAAKECGFENDVLVATFSDFGRRLEENSRKGTDHGWGSYFVVFGNGLKQQVLTDLGRAHLAVLMGRLKV